MQNSANKIVVAVVAVLGVVILLLVLASGSCSGSGGGGGAAPSAAVVSPDESAANTSGALDGASSGAVDQNENMTIEEFRKLLETDTAPTGENARSADSSPNVKTAAETYDLLAQRGFSDVQVYSDFDIGGSYIEMKELEKASDDKYPTYMSFYTSATGVVWVIYCNDGECVASPQGNASKTLTKQIILCESDRLIQYDGDKNEYSEFPISDIAGATPVKVQIIDKATLDAYALDALEAM